MANEVTLKDKHGREVSVKCENESPEKCKEIAERAYDRLLEKEPKEPKPTP